MLFDLSRICVTLNFFSQFYTIANKIDFESWWIKITLYVERVRCNSYFWRGIPKGSRRPFNFVVRGLNARFPVECLVVLLRWFPDTLTFHQSLIVLNFLEFVSSESLRKHYSWFSFEMAWKQLRNKIKEISHGPPNRQNSFDFRVLQFFCVPFNNDNR